MITEDGRHVWSVRISLPPREGAGNWRENKNVTVLALTMERAIAVTQERWPGCSIWNVAHLGGATLIIDGEFSDKQVQP